MVPGPDELYQTLFDESPCGQAVHSVIRDDRGKIVDHRFEAVNPALGVLLGREVSELVGRTARELYGRHADSWVETFARVVDTGVPVTFERETPGLGRVLLVTAFRHGPDGFSTSVLDLTERHIAERQYKSFFDIPNGVKLVIDPDSTRILEANPRATEFYGWTRQELLTMRIADLNPMPETELNRLMGEVRKGTHSRALIQHRRKGGDLRTMELSSAVGEWAGKPALFSILQDVTEALTMQQQLLQGERLRAVGELSANLAHEFGNLLGVLFAQVQLMELDLPPGPSRDKTVDRVRELVGRARSLIESIKSFSRGGNLEKTPVDLVFLLRQLMDLEAPLYRVEGVAVDLVPWTAGPLETNVPLLQQVFLNLFRNALQALRGRPAPRIEIRGGTEADRTWVEFSDNGPGLSAETEARLFVPFFTTKTNQDDPGTGLGLSFSRMVLRRQGGDLVYLGGPGARFRVELLSSGPGESVYYPHAPAPRRSP